jgi:hypothetical protein
VGFAEQAGCLRAAQKTLDLANAQHEVQFFSLLQSAQFSRRQDAFELHCAPFYPLRFMCYESLVSGTRESVDLIALLAQVFA